jgi:hypothetical protein
MGGKLDKFIQAVNGWHDFYIMIGTASATLMGLLFVSLSINVGVITQKKNNDLRILAAQTFTNFLCVLLFAVVFLIPQQGPKGLGLPLLGMDGVGLFITMRRILFAFQTHIQLWGRRNLAIRFAIPVVCFITLAIIGISVLMGETGGLYWLVPVMILLIIDASINAWDLLLRLREPIK